MHGHSVTAFNKDKAMGFWKKVSKYKNMADWHMGKGWRWQMSEANPLSEKGAGEPAAKKIN